MSARLDLVHDVLDKLVLDRDNHRMGRVDTVALQLTDGEPPRVVYIEMGGTALLRRLGGPFAWLARRIERPRAGAPPRQPFRIAWSRVHEITPTSVVVEADAECSRAWAWERWLEEHVIEKIPGG